MTDPISVPRVVIIGGGIIGLATAYKLQRLQPRAEVVVLDKEPAVGQHQSRHNSGVLHAGLYYRPGSAKARLTVNGIREMTAFCREHGVAHEICGKLVVAVVEAERPRLRALAERGKANGLKGLELLSPAQMKEIEPHVAGVAALRVPEEGIVDYGRVCTVLSALIQRDGGQVATDTRVHRLSSRSNGWLVDTVRGPFEADFVVNCAGLHADRVLRLSGEAAPVRIVPFRGEYYQIRAERCYLVRHLVYPVPDPAFPFLGVHFTRMIRGGIEAGPNAVLALAREGYSKGQVNLRDLAETLLFPGLWRFLVRHPAMTLAEIHRSLSRSRFAASLARLVPELQPSDLVPGGAGVRAQAMRPDGTLVEDFCFVEGPRALHVVNTPSPAATASLAIGGEIAAQVFSRLS
jgi:(S)-2-hydroxyglutarate dehydrogenase